MIPLALSILSSAVLLLIFKYFEKFRVNTFQAITINYLVAATLGFVLAPADHSATELLIKPWTVSAIIIGCVFIAMFYIMAISSQKVGVAISSVANKMSLVIPVVAGMILYGESLVGLKLTGVVTAVFSVAMVSHRNKNVRMEPEFIVLPLIIFFGSGFLDTFFKYVETNQLGENEVEIFSASLFLVAALVGLSVLVIKRITQTETLETKSIIGGFALGIPNYFSIHFLLMALHIPHMESTIVFPINNTGIVLLSTLLAIMLFRERLSRVNWGGILLAVASIILIAVA